MSICIEVRISTNIEVTIHRYFVIANDLSFAPRGIFQTLKGVFLLVRFVNREPVLAFLEEQFIGTSSLQMICRLRRAACFKR